MKKEYKDVELEIVFVNDVVVTSSPYIAPPLSIEDEEEDI